MKEKEFLIHKMESSWLAQLAREFEHICYQYDVALSPPVLQLTRSKKVLGSWSREERVLSISGYLILDQPWWVVLQVLKHEMAHQICTELFLCHDLSHGEPFKRACAMLGIDRRFQYSGADIGDISLDRPGENQSPDHDVLEKIRKLMALGQSCNEHEAESALQKATDLLTRYNLSLKNLAEEKELIHKSIATNRQRFPVHIRRILSLLDRWFFVRVIVASSYNPHDEKMYKTIELFGTAENVATAEYCYYYLIERLDILWQGYKRKAGPRQRISRKSYHIGLLAGFEESLAAGSEKAGRQSRQHHEKYSKALVATRDRTDRFVEYYYPKLKKIRGRATRIDRSAYENARETGRKLKLNKPVGSKEKIVQLLQ